MPGPMHPEFHIWACNQLNHNMNNLSFKLGIKIKDSGWQCAEEFNESDYTVYSDHLHSSYAKRPVLRSTINEENPCEGYPPYLEIDISDVTVYDNDLNKHVPISRAELENSLGYPLDEISFSSKEKPYDKRTFKKENGFSRWDVIRAIVAFETENRRWTKFLGHIDSYHVTFDGIGPPNKKLIPNISFRSSFWIYWKH